MINPKDEKSFEWLAKLILGKRYKKISEYDSLEIINTSLKSNNTILKNNNSILIEENITLLKKLKKTVDISKFKTTRTREINGRRMLLSSWLNNRQNIVDAKAWSNANLNFEPDPNWSDDEFIVRLRYALGTKDNHVPEKKDVWQTVREFIANLLSKDCDDHMTFIYSVIIAMSEVYNRPNIKENLFGILGAVNNKDGFSLGNHASLLWKHSDGKYYIIETAVSKGSDYITDSINKFGKVDYTQNIRYGRIAFMSNYNKNYCKVLL